MQHKKYELLTDEKKWLFYLIIVGIYVFANRASNHLSSLPSNCTNTQQVSWQFLST